MHADQALHMMGDMFRVAFLVCMPVLGITLVVGLLVSILQVVTQIQENSLTFIPKMIAAGVALSVFGSWMLREIVQFASRLWGGIPSMF
jgi:flagellar biosynthetic protein FliQ